MNSSTPSQASWTSPHDPSRGHVHVVLVAPENPANIGSIARVVANMGILGGLWIAAAPEVITSESFRLAKHAAFVLERARFFPNLQELLESLREGSGRRLRVLATSSRAGSPDRPHPLEVRAAAQGVVDQMINRRTDALALVFGPEGDGLSNEDVARCDTLVTIPSPSPYRVLNLAQACLVACWEVNMAFIDQASRPVIEEEAPHDRLVAQWIDLAERSGFIHPGDPHKLRPRLERLFEGLSRESEDVRTLHGLVAQIKRNLKDRDNLLLKRPPRGTSRP